MMFDYRQHGKWWDIGLDLVTGCTRISPGCGHCWSAEKAHRAGFQHNPKIQARYGGLTDAAGHWTGEVRPQWQDLDKIGRAQKPQVYTFWNDLFHPVISFDFMDEVLVKMRNRPQHFYIICTKRPEMALKYFTSRGFDTNSNYYTGRLMLMTTAENQEMANLRIPILLQIPGVLHGVSLEPLLEEIKFRKTWLILDPEWAPGWQYGYLDWVICGGETGSKARTVHPDWVRSLRDQCQAAGAPFFFKNWGEWLPLNQAKVPVTENYYGAKTKSNWHWHPGNPSEASIRVGKKAAGRLLDGRTWDEVPIL